MNALTVKALNVGNTGKMGENASAKFWNKRARKYAKDKIADLPGYEKSLARTQALLKPSDLVLELGCGTGSTALRHAPLVKHFTGTDISSEMVAIANEKVEAEGTLKAEFVVSSAEALPFSSEAFDVSMAHNLYHLVDDLEAALSATQRVTKKGGLFISKTPCLGEMNPVMRHLVLPVMKRVFGIKKLHMFTVDEFKAAIEKAGFEIEQIEYHGTKGKDIRPFIVARRV